MGWECVQVFPLFPGGVPALALQFRPDHALVLGYPGWQWVPPGDGQVGVSQGEGVPDPLRLPAPGGDLFPGVRYMEDQAVPEFEGLDDGVLELPFADEVHHFWSVLPVRWALLA